MIAKKNFPNTPQEISPIYENALTEADQVFLGFTIIYQQGNFENIIFHYSPENHTSVYEEADRIRQALITDKLRKNDQHTN
jgi:hypothetical protein